MLAVTWSTRFASFALVGLAAVAGAQTRSSPRAFIRVTAKDSSGNVIPSAEVVVARGVKDVMARGTTNDRGLTLLSDEVKDARDFQVTMRKIGFLRSDRFFSVGPQDTASVEITAARARTNELATVKVTAKADLAARSYHLDADDIENASPALDNGWELV